MKIETLIFFLGVLLFAPVAVVYGFVTHWREPVGVTALALTAGLSALIGFYLWWTSRHIDPRPEDDLSGQIAEGAGELGVFAPHSWWPLPLAAGSAMVFAGMAAGYWLMLIGLGVSALALVGWVYEFYRGEYAH
jgi:hypothetical protein